MNHEGHKGHEERREENGTKSRLSRLPFVPFFVSFVSFVVSPQLLRLLPILNAPIWSLCLAVLFSASLRGETAPARSAAPIRPTGIVLHHSALPVRDRTGREQLARLARLHDTPRHVTFFRGRRYTTGYHYLILRDGDVVATRPEDSPGRHTRNRPDTLGICFAGDFSAEAPTAAQLRAGEQLCLRLMARYGWSVTHIRPHRQVTPTDCPGSGFPWQAFRKRLATRR